MFKDLFKFGNSAKAWIAKAIRPLTGNNFKFRGHFIVECRDKFGKLKWKESVPNGVTTAGVIDLLEQYFRTGTDRQPFSIGLIDSTSYTGVAAADIMTSHTGWIESTAYSNGTRVAWGPAAAASQSISNSVAAAFNINATATLKGIFAVGGTGASTKGATTGNLWATALFSGDQAVASGDTLNITYAVTGA
jgi:hypothetical protein